MTSIEAVILMDRMIESMPDNRPDGLGFLVSLEISNALLDYVKSIGYNPLNGKLVFEKGDEFTWKGIKCKVS